jgi:hypothetical protein
MAIHSRYFVTLEKRSEEASASVNVSSLQNQKGFCGDMTRCPILHGVQHRRELRIIAARIEDLRMKVAEVPSHLG